MRDEALKEITVKESSDLSHLFFAVDKNEVHVLFNF